MVDRRLPLDEIAVVLGKEHCRLDVVAGECADVVKRVEEQDRLELRPAVVHAAQDQRAAAAMERSRALHACLLDVRRVRLSVFCTRLAAPDPGDHVSDAKDSSSHSDGSNALPAQPPRVSTTVPSAFATALRSASGSGM